MLGMLGVLGVLGGLVRQTNLTQNALSVLPVKEDVGDPFDRDW